MFGGNLPRENLNSAVTLSDAQSSENISEQEIPEAGATAELIEDYPDDKYSPRALLLGFTTGGRPLHFQVSFAETELTKIITIYDPDPNEWVDYRRRS
jgi:Domain of unknown function (DUF4258)